MRRYILLVACAGLAQPAFAVTPGFEFIPLDITGDITATSVTGLSADGLIVCGYGHNVANNVEPWIWTQADGMTGLGTLGGDSARAYGISPDGTTVVGQSNSFRSGLGNVDEAFLWTEPDGMVGLGDLPTGGFLSGANASSLGGEVVVGYGRLIDNRDEAFRYTDAGGMEGLGFLPGGITSVAHDVSADGSVIVGVSDSEFGSQAFRWTAANGMEGLGDLTGGDFGSSAKAVSFDGQFVVGDSVSGLGVEAYRWSETEGMIPLGALPSEIPSSHAYDVSSNGVVVGQSAIGDAPVTSAAFVWDEVNGIRNLKTVLSDAGFDMTGWSWQRAIAISADGRTILGGGNLDGEPKKYLARIAIPEPSCLLLTLIGVVAFASTRRCAA